MRNKSEVLPKNTVKAGKKVTIEVTAKKVQDAINDGLAQLGATLDEVDVEVLESGGLFKKAKVRITLEREEKSAPEPEQKTKPASAVKAKAETQGAENKTAAPEKPQKPQNREKQEKPKPVSEKPQAEKKEKPVATKAEEKPAANKAAEKPAKAEAPAEKRAPRAEDAEAAKKALEFIKTVVQKMGFDGVDVTADESGDIVNVSAKDGDDSLIIGRHGETLSALSYLAETTARAEKCHINITVDCNGYRDRRAASLTAMAKRRADECVKKHRKIKLEAMERIDRRTVHNALTGDNRVSTASEGKEPHRYVVIIPRG